MGGKVTSDIFSKFTINVQKCDKTLVSNCIDDNKLDLILQSAGSLILGVPFINTIVNPNDEQYLTQYVEDRNYFRFTLAYGLTAKAEITQHQIDTDISIIPY